MNINCNLKPVIGIVSEYNPFHNGHKYLLDACREKYGKDCIIISAMSGDFVQRGEPAIFSKYSRAKAACMSGSDIVTELTADVSLSSAEFFAEGAVKQLYKCGINILCFGAETDCTEQLESIAELVVNDKVIEEINCFLKNNPNYSYPKARESVVRKYIGNDASLLSKPNCILGIEYIKAIRKYNYKITPCAVKRYGAAHDMIFPGDCKSGSELRRMIIDNTTIASSVPSSAEQIYREEMEAGRGPVTSVSLEQAALARLRMYPRELFNTMPDSDNGLGNRLAEAAAIYGSLNEITDAAKTKRYTMSRVRRLLWRLVIQCNDIDTPFVRVLALNSAGRAYLRSNEEIRSFLLINPSSVKKKSTEAAAAFSKISEIHDFYVLAYTEKSYRSGGEDWKTAPFIY